MPCFTLLVTLLTDLESQRRQRRERLRWETRQALDIALSELDLQQRVFIFGSLIQPGRFNEASDIDLALDNEPTRMTLYQLTALLAERLGRPVDILLLPECRFRDKILLQGQSWMPLDSRSF
jgi:predicted nucleotidyltransferase